MTTHDLTGKYLSVATCRHLASQRGFTLETSYYSVQSEVEKGLYHTNINNFLAADRDIQIPAEEMSGGPPFTTPLYPAAHAPQG